jgi:peptidoglycan/LPS O-acetylase OafA/YrhL
MRELGNARKQQKYFASLDGLRGIAAISVLIYHLGHWLDVPTLATNSGLSVDLFFCLSGFVLPLAYQRRSDMLSIRQFLEIRLVRLMPLLVLGIAITTPYVVLRSRFKPDGGVPYIPLAISLILGLFNLPYFNAPRSVGGPLLYPLNGPQYTIFLELLVNALWWGTRRVNQIQLSLTLAIVCFLILTRTGLGGDVPATFWSGFPRVGASFFAGVATFHLNGRVPNWRGWTAVFWSLVTVMLILFYVPYEAPLAIQLFWLVLSPILVLAGARARLSTRMSEMGVLGGALSYPIYCLHYPIFCWINGMYRAHFGPQNIMREGPIVTVVVLILSYEALKLYDEPIRQALSARLKRRQDVDSRSRIAVHS